VRWVAFKMLRLLGSSMRIRDNERREYAHGKIAI
jgi:hypothetical protein